MIIVYNVAIQGTFDDCQDIVKLLFSDGDFKEKYQLGAINSINWARILAQTTYYFASYLNLMRTKGYTSVADFSRAEKVQFVVPTGNFGDILAGFFAKQMGLPIHKLVIATNENDILDRFLKQGTYEKCGSVKMTLSPAMDILISSNFERLLWYLAQASRSIVNNQSSESDRNKACSSIKDYMDQLKKKGRFSVDPKMLAIAQSIFSSRMVSDNDAAITIKKYYKPQNQGESYILDPHTAVGVYAAEFIIQQDSAKDINTICLATASPGKFPEAVLGALNSTDSNQVQFSDFAPQPLIDLKGKPQRVTMVLNDGNFAKAAQDVRSIITETIKLE